MEQEKKHDQDLTLDVTCAVSGETITLVKAHVCHVQPKDEGSCVGLVCGTHFPVKESRECVKAALSGCC